MAGGEVIQLDGRGSDACRHTLSWMGNSFDFRYEVCDDLVGAVAS